MTTTKPRIEPISAEDEAYMVRWCAERERMAADDEMEPHEPAPRDWPVVFLDLDDVLCVNKYFGGLDALDALQGKRIDVERVYALLWSPWAMGTILCIHERMGGRVRWVISSTWRHHFTRAQLREVFRGSGLACVADTMEPRERWMTPVLPGQTRCHEVLAWLQEHHQGEPYVILDDEHSWGPSAYVAPGVEVPRERLVICREWEGLLPRHEPRIMTALRTPTGEPPARG